MAALTERLSARLQAGADNHILRFALGTTCLKCGDGPAAIVHLERAVALDPDYSAAWAQLGRARLQAGLTEEACTAWQSGIGAAERRGDIQSARQMQVFLKRASKPVGTVDHA
ncbi:tetratricopeptide repeat protein [Bosea sp. LC85]|uniref:tetratricopeptide repeat protein n=1 Tax=Bosea sp. LC85 TaxID=1502851 RepID=UPI0005B7E8AF|nr:tetratricopeptide repeat protein [Bosea sp. LC85]